MFSNEHSWIRCNNCAVSFSERELFLTTCKHMFCASCIKKDVNTNNIFCPECTSKTPIIKVDSNLVEGKTIYFSDLSMLRELINDAEKFQTYHMEKNLNVLYLKYKKAAEIVEDIKMREKKMNEKITKLRSLEKKLDEILRKKDDEIERLKRTIQKCNETILERKRSIDILEEKINKLERDKKNIPRMMSNSLVCHEKDKDTTNKLPSTNSQMDLIPFRSNGEGELKENNLSICEKTKPEEFSSTNSELLSQKDLEELTKEMHFSSFDDRDTTFLSDL